MSTKRKSSTPSSAPSTPKVPKIKIETTSPSSKVVLATTSHTADKAMPATTSIPTISLDSDDDDDFFNDPVVMAQILADEKKATQSSITTGKVSTDTLIAQSTEKRSETIETPPPADSANILLEQNEENRPDNCNACIDPTSIKKEKD